MERLSARECGLASFLPRTVVRLQVGSETRWLAGTLGAETMIGGTHFLKGLCKYL